MKNILAIGAVTALTGCVRDTMVGDWEGELVCNGQAYEVTARFQETTPFNYEGQMLFTYDEPARFNGEDITFRAELLYEFTTHQTARAGGQDIYLDMMWTKLYCEFETADGTVQEGGCANIGGIDDANKGEELGYVEMRYSGSDRLSIDDDNCEGTLYWD